MLRIEDLLEEDLLEEDLLEKEAVLAGPTSAWVPPTGGVR
jgi:hypothetical protein